MSEIVQKQMEEMTEEFEEMRRTKLYTNEEIRFVIKKRRAFEEKIHSVTKVLQDFKDYIHYEKNILSTLRLRRAKMKIDTKKGSLEHRIIKRIKGLFETALQRFPNELSLYLSYFKFCRQVNYVNAASRTVESMLKHHLDKPEVWQVAANWYVHNKNGIKYALKVILKGLTIHSDNKILYKQAIEFEISAVNESDPSDTANGQEKQSEGFKQDICCKKIKTYITSILENIKDVEYYIEILQMLESHKFTESIQNYLIEELLKEHSEKCIIWHALAQRELRLTHKKNATDNDVKAITTKNRLTSCFEKYEEGLKKVAETERLSLWSKYLDCLIEINKEKNNRVVDTMKKALDEAYKTNCLPEKYFVAWLEVAEDSEALDVLQKATTAYPKSVDLWKLRLRYQVLKDVPDEVNIVFKAGVTELKENALPLWLSVIKYHMLTSDSKVIESIYESGIKQPVEVSGQLKPLYIEWLALEKGIKAARKLYEDICNEKPYNKDVHLVMLKLEASEIEYSFNDWEKVHVNICRQFGSEDVDVWINYIQFFAHFNKNKNSHEKIQKIYKQAEEMLPPLLMSYFIDKYTNTLAVLS